MIHVILKVALLFGLIQSNSAIRCYICESRTNRDCKDPINLYKLALAECTPETIRTSSGIISRAFNGIRGLDPTQIRDLVEGPAHYDFDNVECQKISFNLGPDVVVVRGCRGKGSRRDEDQRLACDLLREQSRNQPEFYVNHCEACQRDGCNGAKSLLSPPQFLLVLLTCILFALTSRLR